MGAIIDALRKLHAIDVELYQFRSQLKEKQRSIKQNQTRMAGITQQADARKQQATQKQIEADRVNLDLKTREEHIQKLRLALTATRTNREYTAILSEINLERADATKLEESALAAMQAVDELKKQESEFREQAGQINQRITQLEAEQNQEKSDASERVGALERERAAAAADLPAHILDQYDRNAEYHEGDCLAAINSQGKGKNKEFVCGGCNMGLRVEQVNALLTRDGVETCGNCGRFLFLSDEVVAAHAQPAGAK